MGRRRCADLACYGVHGMARWETIAPEYKNKVADWLAQKLGAKQETGK